MARKVETYTDVYNDIMTWFCGDSLVCGKENWLLEGSQVEQFQPDTSTSPVLEPSLHWCKGVKVTI